jgi:hypothetical protein
MAISRSSGGISSLIKEVQYQDAVSRTGGKVTQQVQEIESESEDIVIPPPPLPLPQTTSDDASKMQKDAVLSSCYGAKGSTNDCNTCDDVINAYKANDWSYDTNLFAQCKKEGKSKTTPDDASKMQKDAVLTSCYGAKGSTNDCNTCDDVINAYKANDWSYDTNLFAQCKKEGKSKTTSDDASKMQKDAVLTSCYGAKGSTNDCNTCDDVINAYKANDWSYDTNLFAQCKKEGRSKTASDDASKMQKDAVLTSCYGAKGSTNDCNTCDDVINAYKANDWSYDTNLFAQCKKEGKSKTTSDDASKMQKDAVLSPSPQAPSPQAPSPQASSADSTLYDNKQWESELNPLVVRKNNTESNWVRDVIGYFIVINWLLGAIAFVFTFNWNDTSNRNDMKRSVIIFFFGFWGFLMFEF